MMASIGRNDSCPCGSEKKYKHCCLNRPASAAHPSSVSGTSTDTYTKEDRASALRKLLAFAGTPEFEQDRRTAFTIYWGTILVGRTDEELRRVEALPQVEVMFNAWMLFDMNLDERQTFADLFLARHGGHLSPGERTYLERAKSTANSLYEVEDVRLDEGLLLKDLWSGERMWVQERQATHGLTRWDLLAARLIQEPDGKWSLEAGAFQYPLSLKEPLLKRMRRELARLKRSLPFASPGAFLKRIGPLFHEWWVEEVAFRPLPRIVTAEGDPFVLTSVIFDVLDRERLLTALRNCRSFQEFEGEFTWSEEAGHLTRTLGTLALREDRLMLQTTSHERAERGRSLIEELGGPAVRYRIASYEDVAKALERVRLHPKPEPAKTIPADVEAEVLRHFYDEHYRRWLDSPIPALDGRTPRRAVRLKTQRPKLLTILKEMENHEARAARDGRPPYDFGWLWHELGLSRDS